MPGLGYLASADAAQLPTDDSGRMPASELERDDAAASGGEGLDAWPGSRRGRGYAGDGDYSAVSWLIHRTGITKGAAVGHTAWAKRVADASAGAGGAGGGAGIGVRPGG